MRAVAIVILLGLTAGVARAGTGAILSATPSSVEFGRVPPGTTKVLTFVLANDGTDPATLTSWALNPSNVGFSVSNMPASLAPGSKATVTVEFAPAPGMEGGFAALQIQSNANNNLFSVFVRGNGSPLALTCPVCTSDESKYVKADYGTIGWQDTVSQPFTLANDGTSDITVQKLTMSNNQYALNGAPAVPFVLPGGSSVSFSVATVPGTAMNISDLGDLGIWTDHTPGLITIWCTMQAEAVSGEIMLTPGSSVDFGPVDIHSTTPATKTITIENVGLAALSITDWPALTSGPFTSPAVAPVTIPAGGSQSVTVTYLPTGETSAQNADTATLPISIKGLIGEPQPSVKTISLSGHGADRHIRITGAPIAFPPTFTDPNATVAPVAVVTVSNTGEAPLDLSAAMIDGASAFQLLDTAPITIAGLQSTDLHVRFVPLSVGSFTGTLEIMHDDGTTPTPNVSDVAISGSGVSRMIGVDPMGTIDLGSVHVGDSARLSDQGRTITITNLEPSRSMTITSVRCGPAPGTTEPSFTAPFSQTPRELAPGASASFDVDFTPADVGPLSGSLLVYFDGDFLPDAEIPLTGTGLPARNTYYACAASDANGGGLVIALAIGFVVRGRARPRPRRSRRIPSSRSARAPSSDR